MKKLNEAEEILLIVVRILTIPNKPLKSRNKSANWKNLLELGRIDTADEDELEDWAQAFANLISQGLLKEEAGIYSLTEQGAALIDEVYTENMIKRFNEHLTTGMRSRTYGVLCERVYGKNLLQFNMMDMRQLEKLLELLNLNKKNTVLDLGCGVGMITEYISDQTGANITGLDISDDVIASANERTKGKKDRLSYETGNLNVINIPANSFDTVISIDTLYCVDDIERTIIQAKAMLKPNGQMGIFFSEYIGSDDPKELLLPDKNRLGQVLNRLGLLYDTWDFTEADRKIWKERDRVLKELEKEFEAEDILEYLNALCEETNEVLGYVNSRRSSRYLYHVKAL